VEQKISRHCSFNTDSFRAGSFEGQKDEGRNVLTPEVHGPHFGLWQPEAEESSAETEQAEYGELNA
jgi:hypothetical protein